MILPSTPVPVTPPVVPPRPPLWVVIEPPTRRSGFRPGRSPWDWTAFPDVYDTEQAAQDYANEHPGSVIFRLAGSGETA